MAIAPLQLASLVARNLVPIVGVLFLGWSAPNLVILYSLDSALALASMVLLGAAYLTAVERGSGVRVIHGLPGWMAALCGVFLLAGIFAVPFSIPAYIIVAGFGWSLTDALNDASFVRGLWLQAALSASGFVEIYFAMFKYSDAESALRMRTGYTFVRWVVTMVISVNGLWLIAPWLDSGSGAQVVGFLVVLAYVGTTLYFELYPERIQKWLAKTARGKRLANDYEPHKRKLASAAKKATPKAATPASKAGNPRPMLALMAGLFGLAFVVMGGTGAWDEMMLSRSGMSRTGHVSSFVIGEDHVTADVEIEGAGMAPPARVHFANASSGHPWAQGLALELVCMPGNVDRPNCEIDSWHDRWLVPTVSMAVGLALLLWSLRYAVRRTARSSGKVPR